MVASSFVRYKTLGLLQICIKMAILPVGRLNGTAGSQVLKSRHEALATKIIHMLQA